MFDEISRGETANQDPTGTATTVELMGALGVGATGEAAAKAVITRMFRNKKKRLARDKKCAEKAKNIRGAKNFNRRVVIQFNGENNGSGVLCSMNSKGSGTSGKGASKSHGKGQRANGGSQRLGGVGRSSASPGMFGAVFSSLAKKRLKAGLQEIKNNPTDVLRCGFVEKEPSKHGSTALGCHLMKGWAEQKAGNQRRVSFTGQDSETQTSTTLLNISESISVNETLTRGIYNRKGATARGIFLL